MPAPGLSGFHLGQTISETKKRFPAVSFPKPNGLGMVDPVSVRPPGQSREVVLRFIDGKAAEITVYYEGESWGSVESFSEMVSESLKLPRAWMRSETDSQRRQQCKEFNIQVGINSRAAYIQLNVPDYSEIIKRRIEEKEKKDARQIQAMI